MNSNWRSNHHNGNYAGNSGNGYNNNNNNNNPNNPNSYHNNSNNYNQNNNNNMNGKYNNQNKNYFNNNNHHNNRNNFNKNNGGNYNRNHNNYNYNNNNNNGNFRGQNNHFNNNNSNNNNGNYKNNYSYNNNYQSGNSTNNNNNGNNNNYRRPPPQSNSSNSYISPPSTSSPSMSSFTSSNSYQQQQQQQQQQRQQEQQGYNNNNNNNNNNNAYNYNQSNKFNNSGNYQRNSSFQQPQQQDLRQRPVFTKPPTYNGNHGNNVYNDNNYNNNINNDNDNQHGNTTNATSMSSDSVYFNNTPAATPGGSNGEIQQFTSPPIPHNLPPPPQQPSINTTLKENSNNNSTSSNVDGELPLSRMTSQSSIEQLQGSSHDISTGSYCQPVTNTPMTNTITSPTPTSTTSIVEQSTSILPRDVLDIKEVEWAEENTNVKYPFEMAVRPRYTMKEDPCGCTPHYDEETDTIDTTPCCVDSSCVLFACQIECGSNCEAGALCGNKRITKKQWKKVEVVDAGEKGLGLQTNEDLKQGDFIIEYTGVAIKKEYLDSMFRRYKMERMLYIMALDNDVYIDARKKGGIARYINHSCEPNCAVHRWKVRGVSRAGIFALRDIKNGEELSFDYKWKRKRGRAPTKCYCKTINCRGTLEDMLSKTEEEEDEEETLKEHWKEPLRSKGAANEIMNRTIKIYSEEEDQYFIADVCQYDPNDKKHCLIYRGEIEETWEDLDTKQWMILDEQMEKFVIARKAKLPPVPLTDIDSNSPHPSIGNDVPLTKVKNYVIVQTPMKEKIASKFLVDRCQRHHRVQISISCVYASTASDEEEALEEANALNESLDGHAWKYTITGMNPVGAREYFEKSIAYFETEEENEYKSPTEVTEEAKVFRHEIVVPRCVVDYVKQRLPILQSNAKNAEISFTASRSKSKQFAKLIVESSDQYQASQAQIVLWKEVLTLCNAHGAPKTPQGRFKDLAFYGGELSQTDFELLCPQLSEVNINYDCCENLRDIADMAAFEDFFRCTVWVQAKEDVGRITSKNQLEKDNSGMRKIFFGCEPTRIPELWQHFQTRLAEISRGVKFLNLNEHKDSLMFMKTNFQNRPSEMPSCFFDYLNQVTGATVQMDNFCSSAIRIDNSTNVSQKESLLVDSTSPPKPSSSKGLLVEEIIKLQIELLRDNKIRQQRWGFGRDWALMVKDEMFVETEVGPSSNSGLNTRQGNTKSLYRRYVVNACMEISDINDKLGFDEGIAAHACIILYRYLSQVKDETLKPSQTRQRDVSLACLYLASKCHKALKWKRLESVLEVAHSVYYPSSKLNLKGEEGSTWEKRIISAEDDIIKRLDYDVFWSGTDWIIDNVAASGHMKESVAKKIMELTLSGPVLASGPILWLKLGPEYAFAVMTALYNMELDSLFSSLSLSPIKLMDAFDLVSDSILSNRKIKQVSTKSYDIFNRNRETFTANKNTVKEICSRQLESGQFKMKANFSGSSKQYHIIARRSGRRRIFRRFDYRLINGDILTGIQRIREQSQCNIYFEQGPDYGTEDIIMEGTWRGLAIAENMFRELLPDSLSYAEDANNASLLSTELSKSFHREFSGVIPMSSVSAVNGWDDISESGWKNRIGGKTCIPGKVKSKAFKDAGMRWWLNPKFIPDLNGSLCNILSVRRTLKHDLSDHYNELSHIAKALEIENETQFPNLCALGDTNSSMYSNDNEYIPVSLHRWPPEKTELKEQSKGGMRVGMSPSALQEMQLLTKLHYLIPGPHGHPNLVLPIAIVKDDNESDDNNVTSSVSDLLSGRTDDLLAFLQPSDSNNTNKSKKDKMKGAHLLFQPTPMILQRVINKGKKNKNDRLEAGSIPPTILTAWFHDLLSSIAHCHTNHVVLRTLHPDQILIDNSGVAKMSGLTRSIVLHQNDRDRYLDPLSSTKIKGKKSTITDEDIASNPYMAPELLLGGNRYTQQSDIWTLASLFAHLLIGKPIFSGRDRKSKMRAIFKIVGSPSSTNYKDAQSFPHYDSCKTDKKYKSGVDKALRYMFKDSEANADSYSCILQLLEKMLVLDPRKRMSALDALEHPSMTDFISQTTSEEFRQQFVQDWMTMRELLSSDESRGNNNNDDDVSMKDTSQTKRSYTDLMESVMNGGSEKGGNTDDDDLYNLYDMDFKRSKTSDN